MTTSSISAFEIDGPWLTREFGPVAKKTIPSAESLAAKFQDSDLPTDFVVSLLKAVVGWSTSGFEDLSQQNRQCVQHYLGLVPHPGPGLINNVTQPKIRNILLPVLVLDRILHAFQPTFAAASSPRNPVRPPSHYKHRKHFEKNNKWHEVLSKAVKLHDEGNRMKNSAVQQQEQAGVLKVLSTLNNLSVPGDVAVYNVTQAAFMLRAIQNGIMELSSENVVDLAWSQAREKDPSIARNEVQAVLPNPNLLGIPATLAVAVAISPIYLLSGQNYAQSVYNPGTSIFHTWLASGNGHIVDLDHPLGKLDRLFWRVLPKVACGLMSPREAVAEFFLSPEMKNALETQHSPLQLGALVYLSDEKLETITEPEDVEIEKKMADYLELARKQVHEQESRLEQDNRIRIEDEKQKLKRKNLSLFYFGFLRFFLVLWLRSLKTKNQKRKQQLAVFHALIWARWKPKKTSKPRRRKVKVPPGPSSRQLRSSDKSHSEQKEAPATNFKKSNSRAKSTKGRSIAAEKPNPHVITFDDRLQRSQPEQQILRNAPPLQWEASRPLDPKPVDLVLYAPSGEQGHYTSQTFGYIMFEKFKSDRKMLAAMFESQPKGKEGLPLFVENSARNPNPNLQASATQSIFFVCTEQEYYNIPPSTKHQIHRHRCVILVDVYMQEPSPPFAYETMQQFRDPDALCSIQDMGLKGVNSDGCVFAGPLSALLPDPNRPVLNAVHHPLPHHRLPTPPGLSSVFPKPLLVDMLRRFSAFCLLSPSLTFLEGHEDLPVINSPWGDRQWALWATGMARTATHEDIAATEMTVITGSKMIAIGCPRTENFEATGFHADLGSRYSFLDWHKVQETGRTDLYRWEIFVLRPGMAFYMRAGTPHFVISLEDTIAHGLHSINACQIQATVFNVLHNFITEGSLANAEHRPIQTLLIRIFIYWVHLLTKPDLDQTHAPNIHTQEGLLDLLTLYSYIVLYPALLLEGYPLIAATNSFLGTPAVMPEDRYQEYMVALHHTAFLNKWIDAEYVLLDKQSKSKRLLGTETTKTFDWLCDISVVHMAACLTQYRADWIARNKTKRRPLTPNFTVASLKQQLRRSLCAYQSMWESDAQQLALFSIPDISLETNGLIQRFDKKVQGPAITHFMRWDLLTRAMPYCVAKERQKMKDSKKRAASPGEDIPSKRPKKDI